MTDSDEEMSTEEGEKEDTSGEEEEEEGSFVVEADEGATEGSEDELDEVERALEREDERSHRRWQVSDLCFTFTEDICRRKERG